jgi:hypothetical protein
MLFATVYYYVAYNSVFLQITWAFGRCRSTLAAKVKAKTRNCSGCGLNAFIIEQRPIARSWEFGNEPLCYLQLATSLAVVLYAQVVSCMELSLCMCLGIANLRVWGTYKQTP